MITFRTTFLLIGIAALACTSKSPIDVADYVSRIEAERAKKDAAFKTDTEPVPNALKPILLPLVYYPVDFNYDVPARMEPSMDAHAQQMVYSDGAVRNVRLVGMMKFLLNGQALELGAYVEVGTSENLLFIPFADLTNGTETYGGGRILDIQNEVSGFYALDFNRAYNPSCYYSPTYSCPVPPKANRLAVFVRAGERVRAK